MQRTASVTACIALIASCWSVLAHAEMLHTMPHGRYECALPGDADGPAWRSVEGASFKIGRASSYRSEAGRGTYLLKDKLLTFTRGPMKGRQFVRTGINALRELESDGSPGKVTCFRVTSEA